MMRTYTAKSLRQFIKRIEQIKQDWESKDGEPNLWFRGSQNSRWVLVPKLYRHKAPVRDLLEREDEIREEFVRRAPSLTAYNPRNAWEWYFLMQHYAAPTRLLDWTEDPQIGLYFAVKDGEGYHNAAVWVLDPWRLNKLVLGDDEVLPPGSDGLSDSDILKYKPWLPDRFDAKQRLKKKLPVAIFPNQFDRRIAAQRSCFTVHGAEIGSLERLFPRSQKLFAKIVIPARAIEKVREELEDYAVDEATIYPDLEGLGKSVSRWLIKREDTPHDELYTRLKPSAIEGVGVFAIKDIKKDTLLFSGDSDEMRWVRARDLPKEPALREFYDRFAVVKNGKSGRPKWYGCPRNFHRLTMSWYINDPRPTEKPNVRCDENYDFWALQDIKEGTELTVDSDSYSDHAKLKDTSSASRLKEKPKAARRAAKDPLP
jgi:FRG domain-containing protein